MTVLNERVHILGVFIRGSWEYIIPWGLPALETTLYPIAARVAVLPGHISRVVASEYLVMMRATALLNFFHRWAYLFLNIITILGKLVDLGMLEFSCWHAVFE